jgi:hypothetical protein
LKKSISISIEESIINELNRRHLNRSEIAEEGYLHVMGALSLEEWKKEVMKIVLRLEDMTKDTKKKEELARLRHYVHGLKGEAYYLEKL